MFYSKVASPQLSNYLPILPHSKTFSLLFKIVGFVLKNKLVEAIGIGTISDLLLSARFSVYDKFNQSPISPDNLLALSTF